LQNARLYSLEQQRARQLQAINAIAQQTTAVLDLEDLLSRVCQLIQDAFHVSHVSLFLREDHDLVLRAHHGNSYSVHSGRAAVLRRRRNLGRASLPIAHRDGQRSLQGACPHEFFAETASRMCIPLVSFGQTLGVLALDSAKVDAFRDGDQQSLESVADICATAIQNAHYVTGLNSLPTWTV